MWSKSMYQQQHSNASKDIFGDLLSGENFSNTKILQVKKIKYHNINNKHRRNKESEND